MIETTTTPKKRGRKPVGDAPMTGAQRQRAYLARLKNPTMPPASEAEANLRRKLNEAGEESHKLRKEVVAVRRELGERDRTISDLKIRLADQAKNRAQAVERLIAERDEAKASLADAERRVRDLEAMVRTKAKNIDTLMARIG